MANFKHVLLILVPFIFIEVTLFKLLPIDLEEKNIINEENNEEGDGRWGLCNTFPKKVKIERMAIPTLNITAFFLACTFQDDAIVITTFLEKMPPDLPLFNEIHHPFHAKNFKSVKLSITLEGDRNDVGEIACDTPKSMSNSVVSFRCAPPAKSADMWLFKEIQSSKKITVYIRAQGMEYIDGVSLNLCNKKKRIHGTAMCTTYMSVAGRNWMDLYKQSIEYHRVIGVDKMIIFEHTEKHKAEFNKYYNGSDFVSRIQWPPLTSRPDLFYSVLPEGIANVTRECYDQTLIATYCVLNSDYEWTFSMDMDEYIWNSQPNKPLLDIIEAETKGKSCLSLPTKVMLGNYTGSDKLVIEKNDYECNIYNCGKTVYKSSETYGLNVHGGKTKNSGHASKILYNLHFRGMYINRNPINDTLCTQTDKYYKPYADIIWDAVDQLEGGH